MPSSPYAEAVSTRAEQQLSPWEARVQVWAEAAGRFSHFWVRTCPYVLHIVSSRRRQKSQRLVGRVQLGSEIWWFRIFSSGACLWTLPFPKFHVGPARFGQCLFSWAAAQCQPWGCGQVWAAAAASPWGCSGSTPATFSQSWCFSELACSSLVLLSGRIACITKTSPPFLPVVIS